MNKIVLAVALVSLFGSVYYFFFEKNLLWGSVTILLSVALSLIYATMNKVNKITSDIEKK